MMSSPSRLKRSISYESYEREGLASCKKATLNSSSAKISSFSPNFFCQIYPENAPLLSRFTPISTPLLINQKESLNGNKKTVFCLEGNPPLGLVKLLKKETSLDVNWERSLILSLKGKRGIVPPPERGFDKDQPCDIYPYYVKKDLFIQLDTYFPPERSLFCMLGMAISVLSVHEEKMAHVDIKLENYLVDTSHNLLLCDFAGSFKEKFNRRKYGSFNLLEYSSFNLLEEDLEYLNALLYKANLPDCCLERLQQIDIACLGGAFYYIFMQEPLLSDEDLDDHKCLSKEYVEDAIKDISLPHTGLLDEEQDVLCEDLKTLLSKMLHINPQSRPSIQEVLQELQTILKKGWIPKILTFLEKEEWNTAHCFLYPDLKKLLEE